MNCKQQLALHKATGNCTEPDTRRLHWLCSLNSWLPTVTTVALVSSAVLRFSLATLSRQKMNTGEVRSQQQMNIQILLNRSSQIIKKDRLSFFIGGWLSCAVSPLLNAVFSYISAIISFPAPVADTIILVVLLLAEVCRISVQKSLVVLIIRAATIQMFIDHKARWRAIQFLELGIIWHIVQYQQSTSKREQFQDAENHKGKPSWWSSILYGGVISSNISWPFVIFVFPLMVKLSQILIFCFYQVLSPHSVCVK